MLVFGAPAARGRWESFDGRIVLVNGVLAVPHEAPERGGLAEKYSGGVVPSRMGEGSGDGVGELDEVGDARISFEQERADANEGYGRGEDGVGLGLMVEVGA